MTDTQPKVATRKFAADWKGKGYEKGHSQTFWLALLSDMLDVEDVGNFIMFEEQVHLDHTSFIDSVDEDVSGIDRPDIVIEYKKKVCAL